MVFAQLTHFALGIVGFCFIATTQTLMHRQTVNNANEKGAICNDGSNAVYFMEKTKSNKWMIFLESGGGCFDYDSCWKRKITEPYLFGAGLYPMEVTGEDLLSAIEPDNMFFEYNKVLIPYCSSDLWLGNRTLSFRNDMGETLEVYFRGASIFRAVIQELNKHGLVNASEIWLGGSSAGGIGVINHVQFIMNTYKANIFALTDSSWFINYQNMLSKEAVKQLISAVSAVPACSDTSLEYPCCLSIFCLVSKQYFPRDVQLFNVLSRYDIYGLSQGIMMPGKLTRFEKTSKIVSDMLAFGGEVSHSMRLTKSIPNMHSIVTSCFQHSFFATSSLWSPGGLFNTRSQTSFNFPLFIFRHSVKKGRWNKVAIKGKTINKILQSWYESIIVSDPLQTRNGSVLLRKAPSVVEASCRRVQCNPTCPKSIHFYSDENSWPKWTQWSLLILYLVFTISCLSVKILWTVRRLGGSRTQNGFVSSLYNSSNTLKAVGLPCCIPSNYIGLSCTNVEYSVSVEGHKRQAADGKKWHCGGKKKSGLERGKDKRQILKGINAYFNPGQLVAIMGPSGSGKTTLLDILTGRKDSKESKVYINGLSTDETREWFRRHSGYVLQLATPYYEELTVRENLTFSALMRLPKTMSIKNKLMRVEQVIGQAGLNDYADVVVGSATGPGLSGGQKRRLCVAIQLLRVPSVLFLDEPTSGLDSASSLELLETLHGLTLSGRLVILTIHQPRIEIFHMFDRILFLSKGHVAYFGSPIMAPTMIAEALKSSGEVLDASNPADTIMDVLIFKKSQEMIVEHYQESGEIEAIKKAIAKATKNPVKTLSMKVKRYSSSLSDRLLAFDCRSSTCQTRAQKLYLLIIFLLYGLALGSVYWQTDSGILLMSCYQVFLCASQLFMASVIHTHFNKAVPVFALEQAEGIGKPHELVLHTFIRISALTVLPLFLCSTIIYLCTVVELNLWKFFVTTLIHMQLNHVWIAIIMLTACAVPRYSTLICPMLSAVSGFAGGFLVPEPKMPAFYYWLFYVNPTHWAYSSTMKILIDDVMFECSSKSRLECQSNMGIAVLHQFGFDRVNPYRNMIIQMAMLVVFLCTTMALLEIRYTNKMRKWSRHIKRVAEDGSERLTKIYNRLIRDRKSRGWKRRRLVDEKDIEANGSCGVVETEMSTLEKSNDVDYKRENQHEKCKTLNDINSDLLPLLLPVKVDPMLTARVHTKDRPKTISVFSIPNSAEGKAKPSLVVRSNTFTYDERPTRFTNTGESRKESLKSAKFQESALVPNIVVENVSIGENSPLLGVSRSRSETCETEPDACLSRYLDTILKPHEVYCSVSGGRPKSSRRRSVTKRLPDEVKRSESVHIQRKASMLILAERRKSMTAQITGFGQVFAYLNEIGVERKPIMRKNMAFGVKRKVENKRQQRASDGSSRASCVSNDRLKVPDSFPDGEMSLLEIRRSRMMSQKAIDIPDENSNAIIDRKETTELPGNEVNVPDQMPGRHQISGKGLDTNEMKSPVDDLRTDKNMRESFTLPRGTSPQSAAGRMTEPVKVSALKISRKKFVPLKDCPEDFVKMVDKHDNDSRSSVCRTPLGSIDETEEDEQFSVAEYDRKRTKVKVSGLRRSSLQNAQQRNHFSENFSEIKNWLYHSSRALNEEDELSGSEASRKTPTKAAKVTGISGSLVLDSEEEDEIDAEIDAEISRAFGGNNEKLTLNANESVISSDEPKSSDSGIRSGEEERFQSKKITGVVQKNLVHIFRNDTKSTPVSVPAIVVTTGGSPSPKMFSNALFIEEHCEFNGLPPTANKETVTNGPSLGLATTSSFDGKYMAWETRSNEEFSMDGYEHLDNSLSLMDDSAIPSSPGSGKATHFRRSSSCEFDYDIAEAKNDNDIARIRSLRRKSKKKKMDIKTDSNNRERKNQGILNETVL